MEWCAWGLSARRCLPGGSGPRSMRRAILTERVRKNVKNTTANLLTILHLEKSMATAPKISNDRPQPLPVAHLPDVHAQGSAAALLAATVPPVRIEPGPGKQYEYRERLSCEVPSGADEN